MKLRASISSRHLRRHGGRRLHLVGLAPDDELEGGEDGGARGERGGRAVEAEADGEVAEDEGDDAGERGVRQDRADVGGEVDVDTFIGGCLRLKGMASSIDVQTLDHHSIEMLHLSNSHFPAI